MRRSKTPLTWCSFSERSHFYHATNKGVPRTKVTTGFCKMMAHKILGLHKKVEKRDIMITGGIVKNQMMVAYLKKETAGLIALDEATFFEALGAAL